MIPEKLNCCKWIALWVLLGHYALVAAEASENNTQWFQHWEISGQLGVESLGFWEQAAYPGQPSHFLSAMAEMEFVREWDNGRQSFAFVPFYRYSQHDNRRTHFDIRELTWLWAQTDWELRIGFRKVFWGVAEGLHLIDIINQTDYVENTDTEDKLGQPMINLALIGDLGTLDLFILTGFRERTFPGEKGRFRPQIAVSSSEALFERSGLAKHMAYALRWSHYFGNWDVGLAYFYGMGREPILSLSFDESAKPVIKPYYELIQQTSIDVQMTDDAWLWKLEAMFRSSATESFFAAVGGLEYTFFNVEDTGLDVGLVLEYMFDGRGSGSQATFFQDDFLMALRLGFNDEQSSELLAGVLIDRNNQSRFYNLEMSRRIGDNWKLEAELRWFSAAPASDPVYAVRQDDHIRVELSYHF